MPSNDDRVRARVLHERARTMRKAPTKAETRLWTMLRDRRLGEVKFRRQRVIAPYSVDFVCLERHLIIEADGGQHAEDSGDNRRDAYLRSLGYRVLRFCNADILNNPAGVFEAIYAALHTPHPSAASPLPPSPVPGEGMRKDHG